MTIAADLTTDRQRIALVAGGVDIDVAKSARRLQQMTPAFAKSKPAGGLMVSATWPAVVQLSLTFGDSWAQGPDLRQWVTDQVELRTQLPDGLTLHIPAGCVPRPYQVDGALMIAVTGRALLFDEPGTGKTITTILGLVERAGWDEPVFPIICVVPASVVDPWVEAWNTWAPALTAVAWRGPARKRRTLAGTADVYVTSYDTARNDAPSADPHASPLVALEAKSVVIDECHLIKSPRAQRSLAARRLAKRAANVVALSGTPITHHPGDLWPTLNALEPGAWPSGERFVNRFCDSVAADYNDQIIGLNPAREPEFRMCLLGQHRRVAKADVLEQLPPKVYTTRTVQLPDRWRKAYDDMEETMLAELPDGEELSVMSVLAQLTRLGQMSSAATDIAVTVERDEDGTEHEKVNVTLKSPSWKVDALLEVLDERPGEPVVAFAPSRQLMMLAGQAAAKAELNVGYIVGGQSMTERTDTIEQFQAGKLDLLCATTGAGGVGITLTAARTAVFLQRPWSLVEATQAEDRLHRIGAERHESIEIVDVIAANTIDTRIRAVLRSKAGQLADLVQDSRIVAELLGGTSRKAAA